MFGNYHRTLDDKKRLVLPAKFRDNIGSIIYVTFGPDQVLELRSKKSFLSLSKKLLSNNILNKTFRKYARALFGNTVDLNVDKLGRINFPKEFLTKAAINKEVTCVGVGDKIELWDKDTFAEFQNNIEEKGSLDIMSKQLFDSGVNL